MHTIHFIAVEADSKEQAFETVRSALLHEEPIAPWSDWHVVGGGRWNSAGSQYEDNDTDVISFADTPDKYAETLEQVKTWRVEQMKWYLEQYQPDDLITNARNFIDNNGQQKPEEKFNMNYYYATKISDMLAGHYNSDSHFYDLNNYSANMEYLEPNSRSYLVSVDYHH